MKIEVEIYSAGEFAAFANFCATVAGVLELERLSRGADVVKGPGASPAIPAEGDPTKLAELVKAAGTLKAAVEAAPPAAPKATRTRKPTEAVTGAVGDTAKLAEPPAVTMEEVKKMILDHLNEWTEAAPADKDVRIKVLGPLLKALGSEKIKEIDPARFKEVAGLIDESNEALAKFKAERAPSEEE